jgi:hypothetical protein
MRTRSENQPKTWFRLGSRNSDPSLYWGAVAVTALLTIAVAALGIRLFRRGR